MSIRTISDVIIMGHNSPHCLYFNTKNKARFSINKSGFDYTDPFGNYMTSAATNIMINFKSFELNKMGDEIKKTDGTSLIMMPKEQIQEIANKTFYEEGQFHAIDFLTFTITEEK